MKSLPRLTVCFAAFLPACLVALPAADSQAAETDFLTVDSVAAQPLLAHVKRLQEALTFIGRPLSADDTAALSRLNPGMPDADVTKAVQQVLDRHVLTSVNISEGELHVSAGPVEAKLLEQGWRSFLVKVVNSTGTTSALEASSPNAGKKANAPADKVDELWMDLSMFDGRPLNPRLSGLGLEYRILQLFSSSKGDRKARLRFRVGDDGTDDSSSTVREWTFDDGIGGWDTRNGEADLNQGVLRVTPTGQGPAQLVTDVDVDGGLLVLRAWLDPGNDHFCIIHWTTDDQPQFSRPGFAKRLQVTPGPPREIMVPIRVEGRLKKLRIDLPRGPDASSIDWILLSRADQNQQKSAHVDLSLRTVASTPVTFHVLDEHGEPAIAAFRIEDSHGRVYPARSKRLAPDFFFHPQVYRANGEQVHLPPGNYSILCWRGPESVPETKTLTVTDSPAIVNYRVQRWIDPSEFGWYSGDHHIHAAGCRHYTNPTEGVHAIDMARHCRGEDLKVGCNLTWGPCFDYQKQYFTGEVDKVSQYPYLIRYDIEVSGFGSHRSGHLCLLRLQDQMYPGGDSSDHWPTLGLNTLRWAKSQGAITGPAHSGSGLSSSVQRVEGRDGPPLPGWRHNGPLPHYGVPRYDGIGANEFIMDITHNVPGPDGTPVPAVDFISAMDTDRVAEWNMWYHTLNCNFRVRASGETDFPCISGDRVGMGRVYVKVDGELGYDDWCEGIREGRSYVSDGTAHLIDLMAQPADASDAAIALGQDESELQLAEPGTIRLTLQAAIRRADVDSIDVELIKDGYAVDTQSIPADGSLNDVTFDAPVAKSSWLAVRASGSAHTNPFFVIVDGKPIRASVGSAEWCRKGVDVCWESKKGTYAEAEQEDAQAAYEHARQVYDRIIEEARAVN